MRPLAWIVAFEGRVPQVHPTAYLAPTAVLIGDVVVQAEASVWFGAVLRGDFNRIVVGEGSCVQDNAVLHAAEGLPTVVGRGVTVGHMALLEGCVIGDGAVLGMGSVVLQRARVGERAMVAAGAVVREGMEVPPGTLAAGVPAEVKKNLSGSALRWVEMAAREYVALRRRYLEGARLLERPAWPPDDAPSGTVGHEPR